MSPIRPFALAAALLAATPAHAADHSLSLTADGSSRWYEFVSDAFAQLDRGFNNNPALDGFYLISAEPDPWNPTVFQPIGGGADVFPHEADFASIGTITYTGSGNGTFPITAITLDVARYVADDDALTSTGYTTTVTAPSGTITFAGGQLVDLTLTANVRFTYDGSGFGLGNLSYDGTFEVDGGRFSLFVDDSNDSDFGPLRYVWDVAGAVAGLDSDVIFRTGFEG